MANKNRREQTPKSNRTRHVQELRQSNASGPHKRSTDYRRKPKHVHQGWDED